MSTPYLGARSNLLQAGFFVALLSVSFTALVLLYPRFGPLVSVLSAPFIVLIAWHLGTGPTFLYGFLAAACMVVTAYLMDGLSVALGVSRLLAVGTVMLFTIGTAVVQALVSDREKAYRLLKLTREIADDGTWDWRIREGTVEYADRWFTMLGYEPGKLPGDYATFANLLHPEDRERVESIVASVVAGPEDSFQTDFRLRTSSDGYCSVLSRGKVTERDKNGRAVRMIGVHSDITSQKRVEEEIVFYAYHNQLTGLPNRKSFYERLTESLQLASRSKGGQELRGLIALDIDDFKSVNDMHGQMIADQVIVAFAERLRSSIRESDFLFHLSGDDFCIVLNSLTDDSDVGVVADKIRRRAEEPLAIGDMAISVRSSMGLAIYPRDGEDATGLASSAETALVEAKRERNTYRFYTEEMHTRVIDRVNLIDELRESIRDERFTVYYQPIVGRSREMVAAEALVRWNHPVDGLKGPGSFVDVAEETGLIVDIGAQVIGRVCADLRKMIDLGRDPVPISVNLSVKQLSTRDVVGQIQRSLSFHRIPEELLGLEITESSIMENMSATLSTIEALILLGMRFSIDDFGTGYSSLSYLKRLPIHTVKIDRSFVRELPNSRKDAAIIRSVIAMADGLGLDLVAEGVETGEQEAFLRAAGCPKLQGYLYSKPVPREQLESLIMGESPAMTATPSMPRAGRQAT